VLPNALTAGQFPHLDEDRIRRYTPQQQIQIRQMPNEFGIALAVTREYVVIRREAFPALEKFSPQG
jgi:hypothetical protein